jgi:PAS domain S-box-containing protein
VLVIGLLIQRNLKRKAEASVQQKTEELDQFFNVSLDLLCIANTDSYFLRLNPAWERILGYSREELTAKRFLDFVHPDDLLRTQEAVSVQESQQRVIAFENRYRCKDGTYRWLEWSSVPAGNLIYAAARDITERKRAEAEVFALNTELEQRVRDRTAQLEAANRELEAFAYSVSHDLRAPLRAMDGFSGVLLSSQRARLDEQGQHYLDRIQEAACRMGLLIDDLLKLSRVSRGALERTRVDLGALAGEIAAELRARDPLRQAEFAIEEGMIVEGDARLLRIALENLLGNAWKFTGPRPAARIEVGAMEDDGDRVYHVRDNGVGFDMAYASKLFAPFQRLHGMQEFPGTGIGLATVQRIVARHGGRVWARAEVSGGATFSFTLGGD